MNLRSLSPALKGFKPIPIDSNSLRGFLLPQYPQALIDKLDLKLKYPNAKESLEIVDIYSGNGFLSSMINYELKPKKHILIENLMTALKSFHDLKTKLDENPNSGINFEHHFLNAFKWETYPDMIQRGVISPEYQSRDKVHDEMLIFANLLGNYGESLFAQWLMCSAYQNWLQRYGRVRMICIIPEVSAKKFLSRPLSKYRNRTGIKLELFADTKLIAVNESDGTTHEPDGYVFDPLVLINDQPIVLPSYSIFPHDRFAVVEVIPKEKIDIDIPTLEYVTQILLFRKATPLNDSIEYLGAGAGDFLKPRLSHLLDKTIRDLNASEVVEVVEQFELWPFKPTKEEMISINKDGGTDE